MNVVELSKEKGLEWLVKPIPTDKEFRYQWQLIDCNCNDCGYLERDFALFKKWECWNREIQLRDFDNSKAKGFVRNNASFQFDKSSLLMYGKCLNKGVSVSFIAGLCSLSNRTCFKHRRDI